jgi:hypothetical protein
LLLSSWWLSSCYGSQMHSFTIIKLCAVQMWHRKRRPWPGRFTAMLLLLARRRLFIPLDSRCFSEPLLMKMDTENYTCSRFRGRYGLRGKGATSWVLSENGLGAVAAWGDNRGTECTHGEGPKRRICLVVRSQLTRRLGSDLGGHRAVSSFCPWPSPLPVPGLCNEHRWKLVEDSPCYPIFVFDKIENDHGNIRILK